MRKILLVGLLFVLPLFLLAQTELEEKKVAKSKPKSEFGIFLGWSNSGTDVHSWARHGEGFFSRIGFAYGVNYTYNFNHHFGVRLSYNGTKIQGHDEGLTELDGHDRRGYSFTSPLHEIGAFLKWDIISNGYKDDGSYRRFIPYLLGGVAFTCTDPEVDWNNDVVPHSLEDEENVGSMYLQVPVGLGLKYNLSEKMFLSFEVRSVFPLTDYLDGISESADPTDNDSYTFFGVNFGWNIGDNDRDRDGIVDYRDGCPDVFGTVELCGCPDTDGDGVTDTRDQCPLVPGDVNLWGCPDSDGDGIADKNDACPSVPGLKMFDGCPDTDGDGVADKDDKCPKVKGDTKYMGCPPPDSDGDGVLDEYDACPKVKGSINGCPDTDGDGIADKDDKCPKVKGAFTDGGCPVKIPFKFWAKDLYFDTSSAGLDKQAKVDVDEIIRISKEYPNCEFIIGGYTDDRGAEKMNQKLSERRAKTVYDILVSNGISPSRLSYAGYGELNPKYPNGPKGNRMNRRVEVRFKK